MLRSTAPGNPLKEGRRKKPPALSAGGFFYTAFGYEKELIF